MLALICRVLRIQSYSFGSELSCVEAGPDELLSIGASIDCKTLHSSHILLYSSVARSH